MISASQSDQSGPVIEIAPALARLGNDETLLNDLAIFYLEDSPILLNSLSAAIQSQDFDLIMRSAHNLKGLSANFNAKQAVAHAQMIETSGRNTDLATAKKVYPALVDAIQSVMTALEKQVLNR